MIKKRTVAKVAIGALLVVLLLYLAFELSISLARHKFEKKLAQYKVAATERLHMDDVQRIYGEPAHMISEKKQFEKASDRFIPHESLWFRPGRDIWVYYVDWYEDGSGGVVYFVFDKDKHVVQAVAGGY